jgi:hypothetical protein
MRCVILSSHLLELINMKVPRQVQGVFLLQSSKALCLVTTAKQMKCNWQDLMFSSLVILSENDINKGNIWIIWQQEFAVNTLFVPPGLTFTNPTFCPHNIFMCFIWISEQTAIISLYSINWLVCITETENVYCSVRTESFKCNSGLQGFDHSVKPALSRSAKELCLGTFRAVKLCVSSHHNCNSKCSVSYWMTKKQMTEFCAYRY